MPPPVTVATVVLPLLHVPPVVALLKVSVDPGQMVVVPAIEETFSHIVTLLLFHRSPASAKPSWFTAFTAP
jgi:hypothetical protein